MLRVLQHSVVEWENTDALVYPQDESAQPAWRPLYRQSIIGIFPRTVVEIQSVNPPADFFVSGGFCIVSERLRTVLQGVGVRAEYFPVEMMHGCTRYTDRAFYFANFTDEIDCLDEVHGRYEYRDSGGVRWVESIQRLSVDESRAVGHDLFFVARKSGLLLVASQTLQDLIRQQKISGIEFTDPAEY